MAKRKRDGKRKGSHHQSNHAAPRSKPLPQLEYNEDESFVQPINDEATEEAQLIEEGEEEDYVWDSKPLKSSKNSLFGGSRSYVDPNTNQRGAFPELQGLDGDIDYSSPAADAISYLRMVRHEARGVPNLLTASQLVNGSSRMVSASAIIIAAPEPEVTTRPIPTSADNLPYDDDDATVSAEASSRPLGATKDSLPYEEEDGLEPVEKQDESLETSEMGRLSYDDDVAYTYDEDEEDYESEDGMEIYSDDSDNSAYYYDGAYIARPTPLISVDGNTSGPVPPRVIPPEWHASLVHNFKATREYLLHTHLEEPEEAFPAHPLEWREFMTTHQPSLPILQTIPSESAIKALKHIRKNLGWANVHEWQGKWIWALLARTNDVGILVNEEVSVLRELGKKAVFNLGKAADARIKTVEMGGKDWWDKDMQRKITDYMNGGSQEETDQTDGVANLEEHIEHNAEEQVEKEEDVLEQPPAKKVALFKPRSMVLSKPDGPSSLPVPAISIIPATPATDLIINPMEASLANSQLLQEASSVSQEDELASAQLQLESEIGPVSHEVKVPVLEIEKSEDAAAGNAEIRETENVPRIPDVKTMFALDMVVSIVGDVFGQRDLLRERR